RGAGRHAARHAGGRAAGGVRGTAGHDSPTPRRPRLAQAEPGAGPLTDSEEIPMRTSIQVQRWIRLALVDFFVAVLLGVVMAASHDFRLRGLHVHLNLLGWVSLAVTGVIYHLFPAAAATRAAGVHFWLYNLSLPVMMGGLTALLLGHQAFMPIVAVGSV